MTRGYGGCAQVRKCLPEPQKVAALLAGQFLAHFEICHYVVG